MRAREKATEELRREGGVLNEELRDLLEVGVGAAGELEELGRDDRQQRGLPVGVVDHLHDAPRDLLLFALPLCYLRPQLARELLQLTLGLVHRADRRMSYAYHGYGVLDDAIIHTAPSDLYLFFLLEHNLPTM